MLLSAEKFGFLIRLHMDEYLCRQREDFKKIQTMLTITLVLIHVHLN